VSAHVNGNVRPLLAPPGAFAAGGFEAVRDFDASSGEQIPGLQPESSEMP
jgi:hypothetical protein